MLTGFYFMKEVTLWHYLTSPDGQNRIRRQLHAVPRVVQETNRKRLRRPAERQTSPKKNRQRAEAHAEHLTNKLTGDRHFFYLSQ